MTSWAPSTSNTDCSSVKQLDCHNIIISRGTGNMYMFVALRIPDSYDAKIAKICNFWTFWPVIRLINNLFKMEHWAKRLFVGF